VHGPTLRTLAEKILAQKPRTLLEIGPGPGSLSELLGPYVHRVVLVEKDLQFKTLLEEILPPLGRVEVHWGDFLKTDLSALLQSCPAPVHAVGNLPYNASVAILQKLLRERRLFEGFTLMFQREVADRLVARPGSPAYGSLSVYVHLLAGAKP